jgi:hypothetical protein
MPFKPSSTKGATVSAAPRVPEALESCMWVMWRRYGVEKSASVGVWYTHLSCVQKADPPHPNPPTRTEGVLADVSLGDIRIKYPYA